MADFIAVENGNSASGYLVVNGNVYPAVSGTSTLKDTPPGLHGYGDPEALRSDQPTMTDAPTGTKRTTAKQRAPFRKFHIIGTGPGGDIWDSRSFRSKVHGKWVNHPNGGWREGIEFHYDGGNPGTAGCIGFQDPAAKDALIADPNKTVNVQYVQDEAAMHAAVEAKLHRCLDWSKIPKPRAPAGTAGTQSTTKKGKKVTKARHDVRGGKHQRQIAHKQAQVEGGYVVAEGSPTVFVGTEQFPVSGVDHLTTDGSPLATGEDSVVLT
ncbi:MAG TPA: hypothetical protein VHB21_12580 [Minicystis sp.]|nr:hypothetical protein [Minicystis sp.]